MFPFPSKMSLRFRLRNYLIILKTEKLLSPCSLYEKIYKWYCIRVLLLRSESLHSSRSDEAVNISITVEIWSQVNPSPGCNNWAVLQAARSWFFLRDKATESCIWPLPPSSYWCLDRHVFEYSSILGCDTVSLADSSPKNSSKQM